MALPRKTSLFGGIFSSGSDKSLRTAIGRAETDRSLPLSSLDLPDNEHGRLGLTTLFEPLPPTVPTADLVFIHGLGGGSRKTWSFSSDPQHFWPLAWLPQDADFAHVRIHTFGYKADWRERRESVLSIHDFAQSLVGELCNHPAIRRTATRIILVGHSMGGLVAKMAYVLARQDPAAVDVATRVHSIFFLGTPHRGSDMVSILENMLTVAWGRKPYVTDLVPNSRMLGFVNDTFRHHAPALRLWSFFETLPVRAAGLANRIIVEKDSATLGYPNEEIAAMDADHRHVCKFENSLDSNYKKLRNALVTAIDMIESSCSLVAQRYAQQSTSREVTDNATYSQRLPYSLSKPLIPVEPNSRPNSRLRSFLGIRDTYGDDDLATLLTLKQPGSCGWFTETSTFASWADGSGPGMLWLAGRPAAGKSVLASHVIEQLKSSAEACCSYFIFKHGETAKSTLRDCFKSLAFQMALQDDLVRETLLQLAQDGLACDMLDDASIWRHLFTGSIFKLPSMCRHYWVVDGLDECSNFNHLFTKKFLASVPDQLRLFATSRRLEEITRGVKGLGSDRCSSGLLSDTDTAQDMRVFISARLRELGRPEAEDDRDKMCDRILDKSSGSFLWARLVLQEFENTWTEEAMNVALQEMPAGLHAVYTRMLESIEADAQKLPLATSILTWVTLAARPLSAQELRSAVKLDTGQTLQNVTNAVPDLCGQLVFIDRDDKVHLIHETAREFITAEDGACGSLDGLKQHPFVIKKKGHTRLGSLLLRYMLNEGLKPTQGQSGASGAHVNGFARPPPAQPSADLNLLSYASSFFSDHLYQSMSEDEALTEDLANFLRANAVLLWIEHVANKGDLADITHAAINTREYLIRRRKYVPPKHPTVQLVDQWVTDLIRVATKFGSQLLTCPSSIRYLIPPMCPSDTIISRSFGRSQKLPVWNTSALDIRGMPFDTWDDCLLRLDFQKGRATSVCNGEYFLAIGLSIGLISLYETGSAKFLRRIMHPEAVRILQFSQDDTYLVSCGPKRLMVWDPRTGATTHSFFMKSAPLAVAFLSGDRLLYASQSSETTHLNLATGEQDTLPWKGSDECYDSGYGTLSCPQNPIRAIPPRRIAFLSSRNDDVPVLMAVGYRSHCHPILVWNALELRVLGVCDPGVSNNGIEAMVFNPNTDISALVVCYQEGNVCVFDYATMELHTTRPNVFAASAACSSDGRSLAIGSNQGLIEVFDFERANNGLISLVPIYRTSHPWDQTIQDIAFSQDGLHLIDIRGCQGRVWAPAALVRKRSGDVKRSILDKVTENASLLSSRHPGVVQSQGVTAITTPLRTTSDGRFILAGNNRGEIGAHSTVDASLFAILYQHTHGTSVVDLIIVEARGLLISADDSGRILVVELAIPTSDASAQPKLRQARILVDRRFGAAIARLLPNTLGDRLLICGRHVDELWDLPTGKILVTRPHTDAGFPPFAAQTRSVPSASGASASTTSSGRHDSVSSLATHSHWAFQHPGADEWFVLAMGKFARVFAWADFDEKTKQDGIRLQRDASEADINWTTATISYHVGPGFVIELIRSSALATPRLFLWTGAQLNPSLGVEVAKPANEPNLEAISPLCLSVLGMTSPSTLVFLDSNLWVCSAELQSVIMAPASNRPSGFANCGRGSAADFTHLGSMRTSPSRTSPPSRQRSFSAEPSASPSPPMAPPVHARRHFFALSEWEMDQTRGIPQCTLASTPTTPLGGRGPSPSARGSRDVVFATGSSIVVVKGGFEFCEYLSASRVVHEADNRAPSSPTGPAGDQFVWTVVSGSMHQRVLNC